MTMDIDVQQEKERLAREWLAKLRPTLGLDTKVSPSKPSLVPGNPSHSRKYADVSDDEGDEQGGEGDGDGNGNGKTDTETAIDRHRDAFVKVGGTTTSPCTSAPSPTHTSATSQKKHPSS